MEKIRISLMALIILINTLFLTGCWNYREIDKLAIIAGVAIDKGIDDQYKVTAEIVQISGGKDSKTMSKTITMEGKTIFDAVRNGISLTGKKLYWSHVKVIILSKEVASEGVKKVLEWYNRDAESREDVHILISKGESAKEIFDGKETTEKIKSFTLDEMLDNEESLSKAPVLNLLKFDIESQIRGMSTIIPTISLQQIEDEMVPQIQGTAIIKKDKLVGFLNGEETQSLNFIRNEAKGGVLVEEPQGGAMTSLISFEIYKNVTKVTPIIDGKDIKINLNIYTTVSIDEIMDTENYFEEEGIMKLEKSAENTLKEKIKALIKKVQSEYDADIFGFGTKLREDKVKEWNRVRDNWEEVFKDLTVNVKTKVYIKNSSVLSKSFKAGD